MSKVSLLSVKTWVLFCFYASLAILLYVPLNGSVYSEFILIVAATIVGISRKEDFALRMLCLSVIFSSAFGLVAYYYSAHNILSMQESLGGESYYAIWYVVSMLPLILNLFKTNDSYVKSGIVIVGIALLPGLFYVFTSPRLIDTSLLILSIAITGFFVASAFDTNNRTTRNISFLAGLGGFAMILDKIENIVWYVCDKPEFNRYWYRWNDYDKDKFPVFNFCMEYSQTFTWLFTIGCVLMTLYFVHIFKRSNYTLKAICIPAITSFCLLWCVNIGIHNSTDVLDHKFLTSFFDIIVYTLFAFTFYNLNKKF